MCVRACPFVSSLSLSPYPSTFVYSTRDISSQLLCTTRLSSLEASSVHPCVYIRYTLPLSLSLSWHTRARGNPRRETDRSAGARASRARTYVGGKGGGRDWRAPCSFIEPPTPPLLPHAPANRGFVFVLSALLTLYV